MPPGPARGKAILQPIRGEDGGHVTRDSQSPGDVGRHDVRLGGRGLAEPLEVLEAVRLVQRRAFQMLELGHAPKLGHGAAPLVATLGPHLHQSELIIVTVNQ